MNIRINREELFKRLTDIQYIVDKKSSMEIFSHFLLKAEKEESFIIATDLETAIKEPITIAEIIEEGRYCIPGKKLLEIVRELEEDISIEKTDEGWIKIRSGRTNVRLTCLSTESFPAWPSFVAKNRLTLPKRDLLDMINKTFYAAGEADTKYVLNSLLFHIKKGGIMNVVGTDGHKLTMVTKKIDFEAEEEIKLIISRKSITELRRILIGDDDVELGMESNYMLFRTNEKELLCRLIDGNYPNYESVIPVSNDKVAIIKKEVLSKSLRMACIIAKEKMSTTIFDIDSSTLIVSASNPEVGEIRDEVPVTFNGEPMRIAFSARLLLDSINAIDSDNIVIKMQESLKPALILADTNEDHKSVLMPMRL